MECSQGCAAVRSATASLHTVKGKRENMKKTMNTGVVELLSHIKKRMHSRDGASASEPESEASVVNSAEVPTTNYEKNDSQTIRARNQIMKFASEWKIKIKERTTD